MAGKCKEMSKIKQVIRLYKDGMSKRAIGRELGLYKGTVNKYVGLAEADPLSLDELLKLEDPVLEKRLTGGNPAYSDKRFDDLQDRLPYIAKELADKDKTHVTRYLLWEEYKKDNPDGYEYTQFCFHVNQYTDAQKPSFIMKQDRPGGEYLHIDYAGDTLSYVDMETGEEHKCQVFIAVNPASDYPYIKAVPSQKVEDFLDGLQSALRAFGGVPKILVPDNLKAAVVKSDRYQPEVDTILEVLDEMRSIRCVEHTGKAKHITPFVGAQIDIANSFGFKIPDGCDPKYISRKKDAPRRGRPSKGKTTELEH